MVSESKAVREILFRGKENPSGKWVEGFLVGHCHIGDWVSCAPIHSKTVGQFTGLTDKNDKRIFEGDIIKLSQSGKCYEVKYKSGCFCIGINWAISHEPDCEIIGNIHDNPELLEGYDG